MFCFNLGFSLAASPMKGQGYLYQREDIAYGVARRIIVFIKTSHMKVFCFNLEI